MTKRLFAFLVAGLCAAACVHAAPDREVVKKELAAMEDRFCAMAKENGLLAAFLHYAAPDVAFIDTDPRQWRGAAAVRQRMGEDTPGVSLTWSAYFTDVSDDGNLGYNYGRYEVRGGKTGFILEAGYCLATWVHTQGRDLIAVVLGAPTAATRFADVVRLVQRTTETGAAPTP